MTVYGWDISNHDWGRHQVSLADARAAGISFVTHKVTEGCPAAGAYVDPYFGEFGRQLANVDFPVAGSYHVQHKGNAAAQAKFWFDTVTARFPAWRQHPCWLWQIDAEPLDGYAAPTRDEIATVGHYLERQGIPAERIVVYGPHWVYGDTLSGLPYRLWASNYAARGRGFKALYPGDGANHWHAYSGQSPLILQYSSGAAIGAQPTCDANAVRVRSESALQALFSPPATSKGLTMDKDVAAAFAAINQRLDALPARTWQVKLKDPTDPSGKTEYTTGAWTVYANLRAKDALAAAQAATEAAKSIVGAVAVDAATVAEQIKARLIQIIGGTP